MIIFFSLLLKKTKPKAEESDSQEAETAVGSPRVHPPFAQIPASTPRKLKTLYEALASDQSIISEEDEELYRSSSESSSSRSSLSGE